MNVILFLLDDTPAPEFYVPTFRHSLPFPSSRVLLTRKIYSYSHHLCRLNRQSAPKRRRKKFRRRGMAQKEEYNNADVYSHRWKFSFISSNSNNTWGLVGGKKKNLLRCARGPPY